MILSDEVAKYYAARASEYDLSAGYLDAHAETLRWPLKARFRDVLQGHDVLEIACGTGYWTEVVSATARSVLAVDIDPTMISLARRRLRSATNVRCQVADAYSLDAVSGSFTAAFSHWWWSHVPKSRIRSFLTLLHSKLKPSAFVLFADQLPYDWINRRRDEEGNLVETRILANGVTFEIVKNFPTEEEVTRELDDLAEEVSYQQYPERGYWTVSYKTRRSNFGMQPTACGCG
jgi:SAM-dependent methyltransferase